MGFLILVVLIKNLRCVSKFLTQLGKMNGGIGAKFFHNHRYIS